MRFLLIIIASSTSFYTWGQEIGSATVYPENDRDSLRSQYITRFPDYFFLYPVLKQRSLNFELEKRGTKGGQVTYRPNNSYSFGIGTYLFELGFELAFAVPLQKKSILQYGESDARDVQLHILGKSWGADVFYQKYSGFYVRESNNEPPSGLPYPQRPDINSRNSGIVAHYVFNNKKFSFRSAYNFAERQLYSKGSLVLFSALSNFKMQADSSILSREQKVIFGSTVAFTKLKYTTFGIAPGYTYSLIFKSFFLNGTLALGPAHHWIKYNLESNEKKDEIAVNSFVVARIAIGYNGERIFGGLTFITQGSNVKFEDARFSNNNATFKILLGYRFREFGFLKNRIWDLVPIKI
jgi:hypothetical protein